MDLAPLVEELGKPEYASMTDAEAAAAINAKTIAIRRLVEAWRVKQLAMEMGLWGKLRIVAQNATGEIPQEVQGLAITILDWIDDVSGKIQSVDMDLVSTQTMLGGLVAATLATQEQVGAIAALADVTIPWTEANGLSEVGIGFVRVARSLIGA